MKVAVVHNAYQHRGGEDVVVEAEIELLRSRGHEVQFYGRQNEEIRTLPRLRTAVDTLWSSRTTREFGQLLREGRPDIVHVHNTFPLVSPSLYWVAASAGVPVVQTLHNFRLMCPQGLLLRDGRICEDCVGRLPLPAIAHACYQGRRPQSAVAAGMLMLHSSLGTWRHKVQRYIALNEFCRDKFVEGGLPADRVVIKPNFIDMAPPAQQQRSGLLFVGRLSSEKGVATLAGAARVLSRPGVLRVAGTGPDAHLLQNVASLVRLGALTAAQVGSEMGQAIALLIPSLWFENFPRVLVEALASGLPVLASRLGALPELVQDGVTGLLVEPGNTHDWSDKMQWALDHPMQMARMGQAARQVYERLYTADVNYGQLMAIYRDAIAAARVTP